MNTPRPCRCQAAWFAGFFALSASTAASTASSSKPKSRAILAADAGSAWFFPVRQLDTAVRVSPRALAVAPSLVIPFFAFQASTSRTVVVSMCRDLLTGGVEW